MTSPEPRKFLTAADLARLCEVTPKTVHAWASSGQIKGAKSPGGRLLIPRDEAKAFLVAHGYPVPEDLVP